jgi:PTS system fructose-specific IIA component
MKILASLARRLIHASFKDGLNQAADPTAAATFITQEIAA